MFWLLTILMALIAIVFVVLPLVRQSRSAAPERSELNVAIYQQQLAELEKDYERGEMDKVQYETTRAEIEKQLLDDVDQSGSTVTENRNNKWLITGIGIAMPLVAFLLYFALGKPEFPGELPQQAQQAQSKPDQAMIEGMVARLAARLKENPKDGDGWMKLGRSYLVLGRHVDAVKAYEKAHGILGDDPDLLAIYAEALATIHGNSLAGKPLALIKKALKANPNHARSLWLAGHAALQQKDTKTTKKYWQRLLKQLPPGGEDAKTVKRFLDTLNNTPAQ